MTDDQISRILDRVRSRAVPKWVLYAALTGHVFVSNRTTGKAWHIYPRPKHLTFTGEKVWELVPSDHPDRTYTFTVDLTTLSSFLFRGDGV